MGHVGTKVMQPYVYCLGESLSLLSGLGARTSPVRGLFEMDTAAFAWQEWPVSKTQASEAGEMSPRALPFKSQNAWFFRIWHHTRVVGPCQHFETHVCIHIMPRPWLHVSITPFDSSTPWDESQYSFLKGPVTIPNSDYQLLIIHP